MNIVTTTILRNNLADVINGIEQKKYLLVAKKNKITSALVDIDFFEDLIAMVNQKYLESIRHAREEYKRGDFLTHDQVFGKL